MCTPERDRDLVRTVALEDIAETLNESEHLDIFVKSPGRNVVVEDPHHAVAPLRVLYDAVDILLSRAAVPHENDVLLVHSDPAGVHQYDAHDVPLRKGQRDVQKQEHDQHHTGRVHLMDQVEHGHQ